MMSSISLLWFLFPSMALAAPDRVAGVLDSGAADMLDLDVSVDEDWLGLIDGNGNVSFLNLATWTIQDENSIVCGDSDPTSVAFWEGGTDLEAFVGCTDGTVGIMAYSAATGTWAAVSDDSSDGSDEDTGDTGDSSSEGLAFVDIADGEVSAILERDEILYVVTENIDGGSLRVHSIDPTTLTVNGVTNFPVLTGASGFTDAAMDANGQLYILHSGDNVSRVTVGSATSQRENQNLGASCVDVATYTNFMVMSCGNGLYQFSNALNIEFILTDVENMDDVTATGDYDEQTGIVVADAADDTLLLYGMNTAAFAVTPGVVDEISYDGDTTGDPNEMGSIEGYVLATTDGGQVMVLTDRPWVEITTSAAAFSSVTTGSEITLDFTADEAGSWELRVGGEDGDIVDSGEIEAGGTATATRVLEDGDLGEGLNQFWIAVTDNSGAEGHDAYEVIVDEPPDQVNLTADDVGFGDESIIVNIDGVDDEDLDRYEVYVSVNAFTRAEYPSGGPAFCTDATVADSDETTGIDCDTIDDITVPVEATAGPGEDVTVTIEGVTNDVTYYVAVRAVDAGELEGEMSNVQTVTPQETFGAAELAGEPGGFCGTALPASLALAGLGSLLTLGRRKRRIRGQGRGQWLVGGLLMVGMGAAVMAPQDAMAQAIDLTPEPEKRRWIERSGSIDFGAVGFDDDSNLQSVYGSTNNLSLWLTQGFSVRHFLGIDFGTGFIRARGSSVTTAGVASDEEVRLMVLPLAISGTVRLDLFEGQPIVPYGSIGADYWLWRESSDAEFRFISTDTIGGGAYGWHWALGGQLLLDFFEPDRASVLQSRMGIRDSYLTVEYRENDISTTEFRDSNGNSGLTFAGQVIIVGLRFDFM